MSGDYSRIAFDPWLDDLGVLLQQGRPLTDRDWNDQALQLNRRIQAGTLDTLGAAVCPWKRRRLKSCSPEQDSAVAASTCRLAPENHGAPDGARWTGIQDSRCLAPTAQLQGAAYYPNPRPFAGDAFVFPRRVAA